MDRTISLPADAPRSLSVPRVTLRVQKGPDKGREVTFEKDEVLVGTAEGADLRLSDPTVSRNHCVIRASSQGFVLRDLGSTNGSRIDGVLVHEAIAHLGATLDLGGTRVKLVAERGQLEMPLSATERFGRLLGRSVAMRRLFALLERVAASDATVLVEGETGTGKDAVAEAVHQHSRRSKGPLVVVDCGAIPPNLMESELFGHEKGAFTGADQRRIGALEEAHGGTLFLDEIGELPLALQPKLLRVLESREVKRIGANVAKAVDVRVVAATNRDLREEVNRGGFRQDLYYRLEVVRVRLPPLRERLDDVPVLIEHFRSTLWHNGDPPQIPDEAMAQLLAHSWPGNVRELRNAVERAMVYADVPLEAAASVGATGRDDSDEPVDLSVPFKTAKASLVERFERRYLGALLKTTGGNVSEAARRTGLDRVYLLKLLKQLGMRSS